MDKALEKQLLSSIIFYSAFNPHRYIDEELRLQNTHELLLTPRDKQLIEDIKDFKSNVESAIKKYNFLSYSNKIFESTPYRFAINFSDDFNPFAKKMLNDQGCVEIRTRQVEKAIFGPIKKKVNEEYKVYHINKEGIQFIQSLRKLYEEMGCTDISFALGKYTRFNSFTMKPEFNYFPIDEKDYSCEETFYLEQGSLQIKYHYNDKIGEMVKKVLKSNFGIDLNDI